MQKDIAIFIDINNKYENYSLCVKAIDSIINYGVIINQNDIKISAVKYSNSTIVANKLEEPLDGEDISSSIKNVSVDILSNTIIKNAHIHIRIHKTNETMHSYLKNLHYIALIITKYNNTLVKNKRLSIFLVPESGNVYPFGSDEVDNILYSEASAHLRLLLNANHGVIYGTCKRNNSDQVRVQALDYSVSNSINEAFPVINFQNTDHIDHERELEDSYFSDMKNSSKNNSSIIQKYTKLDHYNLLFRNGIAKKYLNEICKLKSHQRFGYANHKIPSVALTDYTFETAFRCLQKKEFKSKELSEIFIECLKDILDKESIFSFSVFAFIFTANGSLSESDLRKKIKETLFLASELTNAISQLIQNSLQHSSEKACILSLYINKNSCENQLEIILSDLGDKTILDTFPMVLKREVCIREELIELNLLNKNYNFFETTYNSYNELIKNIKRIELRNLFNDFDNTDVDIIDLWHQFRQTDSSAHVGLAIFLNIVKKCKGDFFVVSNGNYDCESYNCYSNSNISHPVYSIPGTEFRIKIPIKSINTDSYSNIIHLNYEKEYSDNYETYAKFIDYQVLNLINNSNLNNNCRSLIKTVNSKYKEFAINKVAVQAIWNDYWFSLLNYNREEYNKSTINRKNIFIIKFNEIKFNNEYIQLNKNRELIIKGLLDALSLYCNMYRNEDIYIAVTYLNKDFLECFLSVSQSLAIKNFPQNLQLFITNEDFDYQIQLFGNSYGEAIKNSYILSIENGTKSYDINMYHSVLQLITPFVCKSNGNIANNRTVNVVPFSMFINVEENNTTDKNIFFDMVHKNAEKDIESENGYKISDTHIRLGNKVHANKFYEMSFLFYRTILANRTAFEILRHLKAKGFDLLNDHILFYGYASYSQAILMSLTSILNNYRSDHAIFEQSTYAIYQYNLQSESAVDDIQVYFKDKEVYKNYEKINVVQIVPISSTLTTFGKMWLKFKQQDFYNSSQYVLSHNHTVFWVRDDSHKEGSISDIEKIYFKTPEKNCVETLVFGPKDMNSVYYILQGGSHWLHPEKCKMCYPDNVIDEVPLIETDPTSTVPSQQIIHRNSGCLKITENKDNNFRISQLNGFVHYGHVCRGKNDYQYYINTQDYFNKVNNYVKEWLNDLRDNTTDRKHFSPKLNIIFSPEHNTNVGFSQYVNAYYFNGTAEIISINEDKEFRSNFVCENLSIKSMIRRLFDEFYQTEEGTKKSVLPIEFYFADDVIITGSTMHKAANLLQSLIPDEYLALYGTGVFNKCFFLVDRISNSSKISYVLPKENFYSFCHIDVSNMRKQGDSCVGCKLLKDSKQLLRQSATFESAKYWSKKVDSYIPKSFQKIDECNGFHENHYCRFILTHIIKNLFSTNLTSDKSIYFDMIKELCLYLIGSKYIGQYTKQIEIIADQLIPSDICRLSILENYIKIISRPFIVYNHKAKQAVLKFIINLSEEIMNGFSDNNNFCKEMQDFFDVNFNNMEEIMIFLQNCVFESVTDLNSTYLLRKTTIQKTLNFIDYVRRTTKSTRIVDFWLQYSHYVQRLINLSSDETRSLWMENLLLSGNEEFDVKKSVGNVLYIFTEEELNGYTEETQYGFKVFCQEMFLSNESLLIERIKAVDKDCNIKNDGLSDIEANHSKIFLNKRWKIYRKIDYMFIGDNNNYYNDTYNDLPENILYNFLTNEEKKNNQQIKREKISIIKKRYDSLIEALEKFIIKKYNKKGSSIQIAVMTISNQSNELTYLSHTNIDMISHSKNLTSDKKYDIKTRIISTLSDEKSNLKRFKYCISPKNDGSYKDIIILFDANESMTKADSVIKEIIPVYFYISLESSISNSNRQCLLLWLILRDIMTYRYEIMRFLAADFTSDVMSRYTHFRETETIMQHEKTISHSPVKEDKKILEMICAVNKTDKKSDKERIYEWIIARNYCNTVIARLYNRVIGNINKTIQDIIQDGNSEKNRESSKLYVKSGSNDGANTPVDKITDIIPSIEEKERDNVYRLLRDIVTFEWKNIDKLNMAQPFSTKVNNNNSYTYNKDFLKAIIYRICFDALRFSYGAGAAVEDFVKRICNHYQFNKKVEMAYKYPEIKILEFYKDKKPCRIIFDVEIQEEKDYSFLLISNELANPDSSCHEAIKRKLAAPLDFADGHLSLITEKEYVSKLLPYADANSLNDIMFSYKDGFFVTKLPIIQTNSIIGKVDKQ